jgi:hypothetical protein
MRWRLMITGLALSLAANAVADDDVKLSGVEKTPEGLTEQILAAVEPKGVQVGGKNGPICTIWLAKSFPVKSKFKPTLNIKYPLTPGQLAGALQVHSDSFADFRGQPVKSGVYTLRYGQQPTDGNHVGTSELSDFLLAVPAAGDPDPAAVKPATLFKRSAKATGSNHPAIFSLLPPDEKAPPLKLEHDAAKELWMLHLAGSGTQGDKDVVVPLNLVVIGKSEG